MQQGRGGSRWMMLLMLQWSTKQEKYERKGDTKEEK